ncbi:MAG: nucleoid-associated protein, YbaB/EbfC family [Chlamydiae bacterium RIFCSPHIGHO2_12_FULL_49_11]|nr:MAG: nucleoid-associated protein, YbaB/EbfC family [Chlamydiae bacterium RIFCSPHIGHO2_12_FULL_49_11]
MGSGFSKMRKQQKVMQEQMGRLQEELQNKEIMGKSEGGLVEVVITGDKTIKSVKINPECVDPSDLEGLQDLLVSAARDAYSQLEKIMPQFPGL